MVSTRWTIRDVELLPEPLDDKRYEIIDGELYVSTQPHYYHQISALSAAVALDTWGRPTGAGQTIWAPGIIFAEDEAVAPDVVWISASRLAAVLGEDGKLHSAPDLVIEVLSPGSTNEKRDREFKLGVYSRRGVREYWIVDWRLRRVEVFRRHEAALASAATLVEPDDALSSPMLPGFRLALSDLFADIPATTLGSASAP